MKREPQVMEQSRQVRAFAKLLVKDDFLSTSLDRVNPLCNKNEGSRKVSFSAFKFITL